MKTIVLAILTVGLSSISSYSQVNDNFRNNSKVKPLSKSLEGPKVLEKWHLNDSFATPNFNLSRHP